jgi:acyl dehydratase
VKELLEAISYGEKRSSIGRTIGEGDFSMLVNLNWTVGSIHADSEHMQSTSFGERILPGVCVLSTTIGLANTSRVRSLMAEHGFQLIALLGFESVRFTSAVYPGDTITVESEILDARPSSGPKRCVARLRDVTRRQTGETVLEAVRTELYELAV